MHLHLTRFPGQKRGHELVINMPSLLGTSGIKDWREVQAQYCKLKVCSDAKSAQVQVLKSFESQTAGNFEVVLSDGTTFRGPFTARARKLKYKVQPICE